MSNTPEFIYHLEELRKRIIFCLAVLLIASIGSYFFASDLLNILTAPLRRYSENALFFTKPHEAFLTHLKVAGITGLLISIPVIFYNLWKFVTPGLYASEKKVIFPVTLISIVLFMIGAYFAYAVVIPVGLHFLLSFQTEGLQPLLAISPYFNFLLSMILAFGILFDFPVFIVGLVRLGVVKTATLAKMRRILIVGIFVLSAILTPSPDPVSQLLLALPLWFLFEISLIIARWIEKPSDTVPREK